MLDTMVDVTVAVTVDVTTVANGGERQLSPFFRIPPTRSCDIITGQVSVCPTRP